MSLRWLLAALVSSLVLACTNFYATEHALYFRLRWFDTPMHVLGGFTLALFAIGLLGSHSRPALFVLLVASAAIGWELFEFLAKLPQPQISYSLDTIHDLINDGLGAMFVYALARETIWRSR